jgi:hypothetical protein
MMHPVTIAILDRAVPFCGNLAITEFQANWIAAHCKVRTDAVKAKASELEVRVVGSTYRPRGTMLGIPAPAIEAMATQAMRDSRRE